jgi:hypothetical protein
MTLVPRAIGAGTRESCHGFEPASVPKIRANEMDRLHPSTVAIEFFRTASVHLGYQRHSRALRRTYVERHRLLATGTRSRTFDQAICEVS